MIDVKIYTSDTSFNGVVQMEGTNSKVNLLRVAKEQVSDHSAWLNRPGIYMLLIGNNCIYVGQTTSTTIDKRIMGAHSGTIDDDWHTVLGFVCLNPTISNTQLQYMENAMCEYVYKNYPHCATTTPAKDSCNAKYRTAHYPLNIAETKECLRCLQDMQEYIAMFPNGIFPPGSPETPAQYISGGSSVPTVVSSVVGIPLYATQGGIKSEGYISNSGDFVVKKDSIISSGEPTPSCPDSAKNRLQIEASNINGNKLLKDLIFSSSSAAASFVTKSSASGNAVWKTADGTKLGDILVVSSDDDSSSGSSSSGGSSTSSDSSISRDPVSSDDLISPADKEETSSESSLVEDERALPVSTGDDVPATEETITPVVEETVSVNTEDNEVIEVAEGTDDTEGTESNEDLENISDIKTLYCRSRGSNARGYIRSDGTFIVLAGSFITKEDFTDSCPKGAIKRYTQEQDNLRGNMLTEDLEFSSASAAANFVMKSTANGNDHWYTEDRVKLGELKSPTPKKMDIATLASIPDFNVIQTTDLEVVLYCVSRGAGAVGLYNIGTKALIVKAGCWITPNEPTKACPDGTLKRLYAEKANLEGNKVLADLSFSSPSGAACFVTKSSFSGNDVWIDRNGIKLGDLI